MNIGSAQQRSFLSPSTQAKAKPATAQGPAVAADASIKADAPSEPNARARARLDTIRSDYRERLAGLVENGTISGADAALINEAGADFERLLARMDNALQGEGVEVDGKFQRAFNFALDSLRQGVSDALSSESATDSPQAAAAVQSDAQSSRAEAGAQPDTERITARLSAAFQSVDQRLAQIAQGRGREGGVEIHDMQSRFGSLIARLESAVAGGMDPAALGSLVDRMMGAMRDGIGSEGGSEGPVLYDANSSTTPLGSGRTAGALDATA